MERTGVCKADGPFGMQYPCSQRLVPCGAQSVPLGDGPWFSMVGRVWITMEEQEVAKEEWGLSLLLLLLFWFFFSFFSCFPMTPSDRRFEVQNNPWRGRGLLGGPAVPRSSWDPAGWPPWASQLLRLVWDLSTHPFRAGCFPLVLQASLATCGVNQCCSWWCGHLLAWPLGPSDPAAMGASDLGRIRMTDPKAKGLVSCY